MMFLSVVVWVLAGASLAHAFDAQAECERLYPVESYPSEERNQYVKECVQMYGGPATDGAVMTEDEDANDAQYMDSDEESGE